MTVKKLFESDEFWRKKMGNKTNKTTNKQKSRVNTHPFKGEKRGYIQSMR